jgi:hypothetical protein
MLTANWLPPVVVCVCASIPILLAAEFHTFPTFAYKEVLFDKRYLVCKASDVGFALIPVTC